ncbi:uncharacterized protein LOC112349068 [Selaginella moellendorffii]|uniref:uncharacterized protein LOC112349068 n=1 Tax=Selaginella moellendorffii TaxID=88036 RepID=UPI000D1C59BE|nr:uncharacterized protein LOC112349068 [Selaginella moellendorffii]|eukprot:XP_024538500.1 uncharacterized protein LOC112349068 [Selaginella moellendorffii]
MPSAPTGSTAPDGRSGAGIFACGRSIDGVQGIGEVALPISLDGAFTLQEAPPYGLGNRTLVDTAVRRAWQIDGGKVLSHFSSHTVQAVAAIAVRGLGMDPICASCWFTNQFKLHRDIEKEPGMFATLILQLPAWLPGRCSRGSAWQPHFDAGFKDTVFFADCEHEIQPVRRGRCACISTWYARRTLDPTELCAKLVPRLCYE